MITKITQPLVKSKDSSWMKRVVSEDMFVGVTSQIWQLALYLDSGNFQVQQQGSQVYYVSSITGTVPFKTALTILRQCTRGNKTSRQTKRHVLELTKSPEHRQSVAMNRLAAGTSSA